MTKLIYLGCLSQKNYEPTCKNAIKIIKFLDDEYKVFGEAPCCGSLAFNISSDEELKTHVRLCLRQQLRSGLYLYLQYDNCYSAYHLKVLLCI